MAQAREHSAVNCCVFFRAAVPCFHHARCSRTFYVQRIHGCQARRMIACLTHVVGRPGVLLRVPRPSASSFTYAKHPGIPRLGCLCAHRIPANPSQQRAIGACRSEIKGEAAQRPEDIRGGRHRWAAAGSEATPALRPPAQHGQAPTARCGRSHSVGLPNLTHQHRHASMAPCGLKNTCERATRSLPHHVRRNRCSPKS
jgi:hypothetical protein